MRQAENDSPAGTQAQARGFRRALRRSRGFGCACFLLLAPAIASAQSSNSQTPLSNPPPRPTGVLLPAANRPLDANQVMEMREQQAKAQNYAAANAERKKQIADDSALLLKLAADLKAEVDKTSKDTLSLAVIRKADEIERLAHAVKEKMKLTVGAN